MSNTKPSLDGIEQAVGAIKAGELIVVVDDDDRENEGDLIMAASQATPEQVAFMIRHTSGILCTPVTEDDARRLRLDPMVSVNDAPLGTAFTISVDYKHGLTTGISADERCATVRALANDNTGAEEFVRPGHIFPLIARNGGVLMRSGHTEAAVDLARMADLPPVGLLAELVNDDGTVKRGQALFAFAREHGLKIVSVADLIAYRQARERLVARVGAFDLDTEIGPARGYAYETPFDPVQHVALVYGDIGDGRGVPARLHREDVVCDVFGGRSLLASVAKAFGENGRGVLVYLREGTAGVPAQALTAPDDARPRTNSEQERQRRWLDIGLGAQILRDLGITSIHLLTTAPRQYIGLTGFGITIDRTELLEA